MRPVFVYFGDDGRFVEVERVLVVVDFPELPERGLAFGEDESENWFNIPVICAFA